ncbi:hypothetical protein TWF506_001848 [Arthrobotrys conoides]|uniref:C2H2-type domain-containing protein n=1 Tax=Arthrobotrys conoides TaxID=74498 RepID=A0AAN8NNI5_9PEZI
MGTLSPTLGGFPDLDEASEPSRQIRDGSGPIAIGNVPLDWDPADFNQYFANNDGLNFLNPAIQTGNIVLTAASRTVSQGPVTQPSNGSLADIQSQEPPQSQSPSCLQAGRSPGDPAYTCEDCGQGFSDRKTVGKHRHQIHKKKEYVCICGTGYSRQDGLKKHESNCLGYKKSRGGILKRVKHSPGNSDRAESSRMDLNQKSSRSSSRPQVSAAGNPVDTPSPVIEDRSKKRMRDWQNEDYWRAKCHKIEREKEDNNRMWMMKYHDLERQYADSEAEWMKDRHGLEEELAAEMKRDGPDG